MNLGSALSTQKKIQNAISPRYGLNVGAIAASQQLHIDLRQSIPALNLWQPLNVLIITNDSTSNIVVSFNDLSVQNTRRVLAGATRSIKGFFYERLIITEISGIAINANDIHLECGKE